MPAKKDFICVFFDNFNQFSCFLTLLIRHLMPNLFKTMAMGHKPLKEKKISIKPTKAVKYKKFTETLTPRIKPASTKIPAAR